MNTSTRSSARELAEAVGTRARDLAGKIRRVVVTRTTGLLWQYLGHDLAVLGGDVETRDAEVFGGVGFASRPSSSGDVEAIIAFVGDGAGSPIIIATRQAASRKVVYADLEADETQIHGAIGEGGTIIRIKADGSVEIRSVGGVAGPLATKADLDTLKDAITNAVIVANDGGASLKSTILTALAAWPAGTDVLKAE